MFTDLKHLLSRNPLKPPYRVAQRASKDTHAAALQWIGFTGGLHALGHDGRGFAFDNELPQHRLFLERYALGSRWVTNE